MVRIGGSTDRGAHIKEHDYYTQQGEFRIDKEGSPTLLNCLMYKMCYYRFGSVYTEAGMLTLSSRWWLSIENIVLKAASNIFCTFCICFPQKLVGNCEYFLDILKSLNTLFCHLWSSRYREDRHGHLVWTCFFNFGPVGGSSAETPHGHFGALILYDPGGWGAPQQQSQCATSTNWSNCDSVSTTCLQLLNRYRRNTNS